MSSFKPIDGSKEDFRKYLDRKGVLDAITKVLIKCNSDRPENAIEYLLDNLGERLKDKDTIARLENELNDARNEIEILKREINALKVLPSNDSPLQAKVGDLASNEDGTNECTKDAAITSSKANAEIETTKNVDVNEAVAAEKTPELDPNESVAQ